MAGAIAIAIVFESAGALLAGGEVVSTISKGIVDASALADKHVFVLAMLSALGAGALRLNFATWVGAPVPTTHSIVGGVLGGAVAVGGFPPKLIPFHVGYFSRTEPVWGKLRATAIGTLQPLTARMSFLQFEE